MERTAKQKAATRKMIAVNRAKSGGGKKSSSKKGAKKGSRKGGGRTLEARVSKLEKNMKTVVAVVHTHQKALVSGGLLSARAKRQLPQIGGR